jgi:hypothetical protein
MGMYFVDYRGFRRNFHVNLIGDPREIEANVQGCSHQSLVAQLTSQTTSRTYFRIDRVLFNIARYQIPFLVRETAFIRVVPGRLYRSYNKDQDLPSRD